MISFKPSKLEEQDGQIGFDLSNFIPKTHLCMIIQKIVCQLDISSIIATYSPLGQKGISPQMLLSVLFYGYTEGIRSGQALSERCKRDLHYIYLSGGLQPSKTTLNDFRRNHHACLEDLFKQQITILQSLEVVSTTEGHGDGTTIRANANSRRVKTKPQYKKWLLTLKEDVKQIQEEQEALANASNELVKKKKILDDKINRIEGLLPIFEKEPFLNNTDAKLNFTDVDAPFMKGKKGDKSPYYNAQIVVDANQFITHSHVSTQANDTNELEPCLEGYKNKMGNYPEQSNFDSGYMNFSNLEYIAEHKTEHDMQVYIPDKDELKSYEDKLFHIKNFQYLDSLDVYICPAGNTLYFHKTDTSSRGRLRKRYQTIGNQCKTCPFKEQCTSAKQRVLCRDIAQDLKDQMKIDLAEHRTFYNKRRFMVEPVFGHWKRNLNFQQFSLRGITKVNAELHIQAIAWNFAKLTKFIQSDKEIKMRFMEQFHLFLLLFQKCVARHSLFQKINNIFFNISKNFGFYLIHKQTKVMYLLFHNVSNKHYSRPLCKVMV